MTKSAINIIKGLEARPEGRSVEAAQAAGLRTCVLIVGTGKATNRSSVLHNAAYAQLDVPFIYLTSDTSDIKGAMAELREHGIRGASIGIPYKQDVMPLLDDLDQKARDISAVNTVVNEDGMLRGYNSDWIGAINAIEEKARLDKGMRAVLAGAGGAGRAIAYALNSKGIDVEIFDREPEKARALAGDLGLEFGGGIDDLREARACDIVVNATPVGSEVSGYEGMSIIPEQLLGRMGRGKIAFDAVYLPNRTRFLQDAERQGIITVGGAGMLLHQAAFQVEKFTGLPAPIEVMRSALFGSLRGSEG